VPLAKSWLYAPQLRLKKGNFVSRGYDPTQRAWVLVCKAPGKPSRLSFELAASAESPVVNPAFVIEGWGDADASLTVNGKVRGRGSGFRLGHRRTVASSNLIVWFRHTSTGPVTVELTPAVD